MCILISWGQKYNNTYDRAIETKPVDVKSKIINKENNYKDPKFKVGDYVRISKYKNIFTKGYIPNCSKKFLLIKNLKILCHGHI